MSSQSFKDRLPAILVGIIVGVLLILAFLGGKGYQKNFSNIDTEYYQKQIIEAQTEAAEWKDRYDSVLKEKTTLLLSVDSLEYRIKELRKDHAQKITVVKSYSNPELEQFFAERYANR